MFLANRRFSPNHSSRFVQKLPLYRKSNSVAALWHDRLANSYTGNTSLEFFRVHSDSNCLPLASVFFTGFVDSLQHQTKQSRTTLVRQTKFTEVLLDTTAVTFPVTDCLQSCSFIVHCTCSAVELLLPDSQPVSVCVRGPVPELGTTSRQVKFY